MKKYLVIATQGGGCDYTIGCGYNVEHTIEAENIQDATTMLTANLHGDTDGPWFDLDDIMSIELVEIGETILFRADDLKQKNPNRFTIDATHDILESVNKSGMTAHDAQVYKNALEVAGFFHIEITDNGE